MVAKVDRLDETVLRHYIFKWQKIGPVTLSPYQITVEWDDEARVWVALSDQVPGLATGAETLEELIAKLKVVIPELLVENGILPADTDSVAFAVKAERRELASLG
jgi:predicted RNase H-like HicB family nuclease